MKNKTIRRLILFFLIIALAAAVGYTGYRHVSRKVADYVIRNFIEEQLREELNAAVPELDVLIPDVGTDPNAGAMANDPDGNTPALDTPPLGEEPAATDDPENPAADPTLPFDENGEGADSTPNDPAVTPSAPPQADSALDGVSTEEDVRDKANSIVANVSKSDKDRMMDLIYSHLSSEDISYLVSLIAGGLTVEERSKAIELAYARFDAEEIKEIKSYYRKYIG